MPLVIAYLDQFGHSFSIGAFFIGLIVITLGIRIASFRKDILEMLTCIKKKKY